MRTNSQIQIVKTPVPPDAEKHQIVAEVEARTTVMNHLEKILSFFA